MRPTILALIGLVGLTAGCGTESEQFAVNLEDAGAGACAGVSDSAAGGSGVTLQGTVRYEDKLYDAFGFTGLTEIKPVRYADVEVVRCADTAVLARGRTDANGRYDVSFTNTGDAGVYLRVLARVLADGNQISNVAVRNNFSDEALHALASAAVDDQAGGVFTIDLTAAAASRVGGIFNILDVCVTAGEFMTTTAGLTSLPPLTVYWERDGAGTFFTPFVDAGGAIFVLGDDFDPDEYDDDVILHEYGHYVAAHFSADDSPGGAHYILDSTQDARLSWSEGWATFFSAAVRNSPWMVDNLREGVGLAFELETPTLPLYNHSITNETAVSSALWDAFDAGTNEGFDVLQGFASIWADLTGALPSAGEPVNMATFFDGFDAASQPQLQAIAQERSMGFVVAGLGTSITVNGASQHATVFPGVGFTEPIAATTTFQGVKDQSYTIRTFDLTNGADTTLEVRDATGKSLAFNDNASGTGDLSACGQTLTSPVCPPNNGQSLASSITAFKPAADGVYTIVVRRSELAPPSAGRYGGFDLLVTSP
jgi:hypothetical protein